ncbi:MAG TPA: RNA-binding domain-containing protein [Pyrinomonadaceae bacterium]
MTYSASELEGLLTAREDEHLEFKEAKNNYDYDKLAKYCAAIANEGGGKIVLGITDKIPRQVVGSQAFLNPHKIKTALTDVLHIRIDVDEINHPDGRVLIFTVPSRPYGVAVQYKASYWMRSDEDVIPMTWDVLSKIRDEIRLDFSSDVQPLATIGDIDPLAITELRVRWHRKSENDRLLECSDEQLLSDAELVVDGTVTNAALILLGTHGALNKYLPQVETVFEYRSSEASGPAQQRVGYRKGFLLFQEELWALINSRNELQYFQSGFYKVPIRTFNETVIREAILNAISHRDYNEPSSIFIRQRPREMEVSSPGGFPPGVTPENILSRHRPRNRRLAEVLEKCGLVERSGQGVDLMFEESIKESKPLPDYTRSDEYLVDLVISGEVQDPKFLQFLERIGKEKLATFQTRDLIIIDRINREQPVPEEYKPRLPYLVDQGVLEKIRGKDYILSGTFHKSIGRRGTHTRKVGLDRETNKMLLLTHIEKYSADGCQLKELMDVIPSKTRAQVQYLLSLLRLEGKAHYTGYGTASTWFPGPDPNSDLSEVSSVSHRIPVRFVGDGTPNAEGRTPNAEQKNLYSDDSEESA